MTERQAGPPLVSVVLCTYGQREFLADAVESVLTQTYPRVELVAIDNGSRDGSREFLERYAGRPNVRLLLHDENRFLTRRLNEGIAASSGEFISILYGDDYYLPEKIGRQMDRFAALPPEYGVVYSAGYRLNVETGDRWIEANFDRSGDVLSAMLRHYHRAFINPISPLVRRSCLERYPFDERVFAACEGVFLFIAMSYRFSYIDEPLVVMRSHGGNYGRVYRKNVEDELVLLERLEREPEFPQRLRGQMTGIRATALRNLGWRMIRVAGERAEGRRYLATAVRSWPRLAVEPRTVMGWLLSWLPDGLLRRVNAMLHGLRSRRVPTDFKDDFA